MTKTFQLSRLMFVIGIIHIGAILAATIWILTHDPIFYVFLPLPVLWFLMVRNIILNYPTHITIADDLITVHYLRKQRMFHVSKAVSIKEAGNGINIQFTDELLLLLGVHATNTALFDFLCCLKAQNEDIVISKRVAKMLRKYASPSTE